MPRRSTFRHHQGVMQLVIFDPEDQDFAEIVIDEDPVHVAHMAALMADAAAKHLYDLKRKD